MVMVVVMMMSSLKQVIEKLEEEQLMNKSYKTLRCQLNDTITKVRFIRIFTTLVCYKTRLSLETLNDEHTGVVLPDLLPTGVIREEGPLDTKLDMPCPTTFSDKINFSLNSVLVLPLAESYTINVQ